MNPTVYYFSGTGNSFIIARDIAQQINGKLFSIASVSNKNEIAVESGIVGIIFPSYYSITGMCIPLIVQKFISQLENIENKYIFAVCTFGGGIGNTLRKTDALIKARGGKLSAGYGVHMPYNTMVTSKKKTEMLFREWENKKNTVCTDTVSMIVKKIEKDSMVIDVIATILRPLLKPLFKRSVQKCARGSSGISFEELVPLTDSSFTIDEKCDGCTTCVKVCPVKNITVNDGKPVWKHHCEICFACFNWCPRSAIHSDMIPKDHHYHHPDVNARDLMENGIAMVDNVIL